MGVSLSLLTVLRYLGRMEAASGIAAAELFLQLPHPGLGAVGASLLGNAGSRSPLNVAMRRPVAKLR